MSQELPELSNLGELTLDDFILVEEEPILTHDKDKEPQNVTVQKEEEMVTLEENNDNDKGLMWESSLIEIPSSSNLDSKPESSVIPEQKVEPLNVDSSPKSLALPEPASEHKRRNKPSKRERQRRRQRLYTRQGRKEADQLELTDDEIWDFILSNSSSNDPSTYFHLHLNKLTPPQHRLLEFFLGAKKSYLVLDVDISKVTEPVKFYSFLLSGRPGKLVSLEIRGAENISSSTSSASSSSSSSSSANKDRKKDPLKPSKITYPVQRSGVGTSELLTLSVSTLGNESHMQWLSAFINMASNFKILRIGGGFEYDRGEIDPSCTTSLQQLSFFVDNAVLVKSQVSILNLSLQEGDENFVENIHRRNLHLKKIHIVSEAETKANLIRKQGIVWNSEMNSDSDFNLNQTTWEFLTGYCDSLEGISGLSVHPDLEVDDLPAFTKLTRLDISCSADWLLQHVNRKNFPKLEKLIWRQSAKGSNSEELKTETEEEEEDNDEQVAKGEAMTKMKFLWLMDPLDEIEDKVMIKFGKMFPELNELVVGLVRNADIARVHENFPGVKKLTVTKFYETRLMLILDLETSLRALDEKIQSFSWSQTISVSLGACFYGNMNPLEEEKTIVFLTDRITKATEGLEQLKYLSLPIMDKEAIVKMLHGLKAPQLVQIDLKLDSERPTAPLSINEIWDSFEEDGENFPSFDLQKTRIEKCGQPLLHSLSEKPQREIANIKSTIYYN